MHSRRDFLKIGLGTSSQMIFNFGVFDFLLNSPNAFASQNDDHFFIYIHISRAWDTSLFSDPYLQESKPKESEYFIEYNTSQVFQAGQNYYGPAILPLKKYLNNCAVINGVYMNAQDIGHDSLTNYMCTAGGGSTATDIVNQNLLSPNLLIRELPILSNTTGLALPSMSTVRQIGSDSSKSPTEAFSLARASTRTSYTNLLKKMQNSNSNDNSFNQEEMDQLIRLSQRFSSEWATLVYNFKHSQSRTAQLIIESNIDTHQNHEQNHLQNLRESFTQIADLMNMLEQTEYKNGTSLLSRTTIMIASEFSRTPGLNSQKGKDHNPTSNSVLLFGPNIKNTSVGKIRLMTPTNGTSFLTTTPITKDTEQPLLSEVNTKRITPALVWNTAFRSMQIQSNQKYPGFVTNDIIKSVLKV